MDETKPRSEEPGGAAAGEPRMPSRAAIAGHPIHPMLVPFPVAMLALAPVADVVWALGGGVFWAQAAWWLLLGGLVTSAVAALAGAVDFATIKQARQHREGWYHLAANVGVIGLTVVNLLVRAGDREGAILPGGIILSLVTFGLLCMSGWYGGELAYRYEVGVVGDGATRRRRRARAAPAGRSTR
jgi:uncharacterized membrane protein